MTRAKRFRKLLYVVHKVIFSRSMRLLRDVDLGASVGRLELQHLNRSDRHLGAGRITTAASPMSVGAHGEVQD